jgi:tetratricopeptide (TPR) repeat protein
MPVNLERARELFLHAVGKLPPERWDGYVAEACGGDAELGRQLSHLLWAHREAGSFLERPAVALGGTEDDPTGPEVLTAESAPAASKRLGTMIGPYKLLQRIDEGGMGTVFMAEQKEPMQRIVALKLIKTGLDSRQVLARFEAERQALALMDHPNIAKVLDAGTTQTGQPYFVMELVKGVAITRYCDQHRLTPRQRIELLIPVCQAVQHAHQKGIIHRDLKPSNVLIALYDGTPVPKVIDFGVAKATGPKLTERTLFTEFGTVIGTPEYMSPEQAELNQLDVDTRSDVYSLGVLLYELLTGTTPLDRQRLRQTGLMEILRLIREEEPSRPSTRLSTTEALPSIAANRNVEPRRLIGQVHGELDWIVMKALEKDRNRRYETANGMARDLQRYLDDLPVEAGPPSAWYRLRKLAWKRRAALGVAAGVLLVLSVLAYTLVNQRAETNRQRRAIETALDKAAELRQQARWTEARVVLEQARDRVGPAVSTRMRRQVEQGITDLEFVDQLEAIRLRRATPVDGKFDNRTTEQDYAAALSGARLGTEQQGADAVATRVRGSSVREPLVAALDDWAAVTSDKKRREWLLEVARRADPDPWRDRFRDPKVWQDRATLEALAGELLLDESHLAKQKPQLLVALGNVLREAKGDAVPLLTAAQALHPDDFWLNFSLGVALHDGNQPSEAIGYDRAAVALRPESPSVHTSLGAALRGTKRPDEAIRELRRAIALDPKFALAHTNLGSALRDTKRLDEATREHRTAIELDPKNASTHYNLGNALNDTKQVDAAIREFRTAIELQSNFFQAHFNLGIVLFDSNQLDEAIREFRTAVELEPKDAEAHFNLGNALQSTKQLDEAIREFRTAVAIEPKFAKAHNGLGNALQNTNRPDEAIRELRTAIELDPKDAAAHNNLGNALRDTKRLDEAIPEYRIAIELQSKSAQAHSNLGLALTDTNQLDEAIRELRTAIALDPKFALAHNNLGNVLQIRKRLDESIREYRTAIALDPKYAPAHNGLGNALRQTNQLDAAIREHRTAIELAPKSAAFHYNLGNTLRDTNQLDEAIRAYRTAIALDPKLARAHNNLGVTLRQTNKLDEAVREYRMAIALEPKNAPAHDNLGIAMRDMNRIDEAIREFRTAVELDPKFAAAHGALGNALAQQSKFGDALAEYREAIRFQPDNSLNYNDLAWLLATCADSRVRDPEQAVASAKRAVQLAPQVGTYSNTLGIALYRAGQFAEAIPALERSLRDAKGQTDAYDLFFLAMCHHRLGDPAKANECRERAAAWFQKHKGELTAVPTRELTDFQSECDSVLGQPPGQAKK